MSDLYPRNPAFVFVDGQITESDTIGVKFIMGSMFIDGKISDMLAAGMIKPEQIPQGRRRQLRKPDFWSVRMPPPESNIINLLCK